MTTVFLVLLATGLIVFGIQCLRHAYVVQANAIDEADAEEVLPGRLLSWLQARRREYARSDRYLRSVRTLGVGTILMGLLVVAALWFGTPA